jgi:predicted amidohydrolase
LVEPAPPYFEQALVARALENAVYVASVNYAVRSPETATGVIAPDGRCVAQLAYGVEGLLVGHAAIKLKLTPEAGISVKCSVTP